MDTPEKIWKSALKTFVNSFLKVMAFALGIIVLFIGFATITSDSLQRTTTTIVVPNDTWKAKPFSAATPTLLKIPIIGMIGYNPLATKEHVSMILEEALLINLNPGMLKGIVLYINTPGGVANDSEAILNLLLEFKNKVNIPIYAYVDGLCASGGMMIALGADNIIASPSSLIGHVGVILGTSFNFCKTMDKIGVEAKTLSAGKDKDELNPYRPWKADEGAHLQKLINLLYDRFVKLVTTYRPKITAEQLHEQGAQVYLAQEALELGYIDKVKDSFFTALAEISSILEIKQNYQVIELCPTISLSDILGITSPLNNFNFLKGTIHHTFSLPGEIPQEIANKPLYLYQANANSSNPMK